MSAPLDITITAPFAIGDIVARVDLAGGGSTRVVLRDGRFRGQVSGQAVRVVLTLTDEPLPEGEAPLATATSDRPGAPAGAAFDVKEAFEHGIPVPEDGRVAIALTWGAPCHAEVRDAGEGTRFGSFEHMMCAALVGLDAGGDTLVCDGVSAWFKAESKLAVGNSALSFGQIIALGGDFYAHLDERAARDFAWAWPDATGLVGWAAGDYREPTLAADSRENTSAILKVVYRDKDEPGSIAHEVKTIIADGMFGSYPARRYLALASQNHCHFGMQPPDGRISDARNYALRLYRGYHRRALAEAAEAAEALRGSAAFERALVTEAFGCHFLTDLFAAGHIRVPRKALSERFGVLQGSLSMSEGMHSEDNEAGLWVTPRVAQRGARVVWRAYGDGVLRKPEAAMHLRQVQEAVRRSVAEIFTVYAAVATRRASAEEALAGIAEADRGEALVPVPLAPGAIPATGDVQPDGSPAPWIQPNTWPRYWLLTDGRIAERLGPPEQNRYTVRDERGHVTETLEIHV